MRAASSRSSGRRAPIVDARRLRTRDAARARPTGSGASSTGRIDDARRARRASSRSSTCRVSRRTDIRAVEDGRMRASSRSPSSSTAASIFAQANGRDWTIAAFLRVEPRAASASRSRRTPRRGRRCCEPGRSWRRCRSMSCAVARRFGRRSSTSCSRRTSIATSCGGSTTRRPSRRARRADEWEAFRARFKRPLRHSSSRLARSRSRRQLGRRGGRLGQGLAAVYARRPRRYPERRGATPRGAPEADRRSTLALFDGPWGTWPQDNERGRGPRSARALGQLAGLDALVPRATAIAELEREHAGVARCGLGHARRGAARDARSRTSRRSRPPGSSLPPEAVAATARRRVRRRTAGRRTTPSMRALAVASSKRADRDAVAACRPRDLRAVARRERARASSELVGLTRDAYQRREPLTGLARGHLPGLRRRPPARRRATRWRARLAPAGLDVDAASRDWRRCPTITSTAKPAVSPVADRPRARQASRAGAAATAAPTSRSLACADAAGRAPATRSSATARRGDPPGRAWTEHGDIDELGHKQHGEAARAARRRGRSRSSSASRRCWRPAGSRSSSSPTTAGSTCPAGCPKVELPQSPHQGRARCARAARARLAEGAQAPGATVPWHWDPTCGWPSRRASPRSSAGTVYEHGGVSPQECVTPVITVRGRRRRRRPVSAVTVSLARACGRMSRVDGRTARGTVVDIRRKAGDPATSLIGGRRGAATTMAAARLAGRGRRLERDAAVYVVVLD